MNPLSAKKTFLKLFIGFLVLTAAIAVFCVLAGDFGDFELRVLASTFSISAASICSMACAAFIEQRKQWLAGTAGIACSSLAAVLIVAGVWIEVAEDAYWKTALSLVVLAVGAAHAFLMLLPRLKQGLVWTQVMASVFIALLAISIIGGMWAEIDDEGFFRLIAVLSIVVVLFTLTIPILMKIGKAPVSKFQRLVLTENPDGSYSDASGIKYQVKRMEDDA